MSLCGDVLASNVKWFAKVSNSEMFSHEQRAGVLHSDAKPLQTNMHFQIQLLNTQLNTQDANVPSEHEESE